MKKIFYSLLLILSVISLSSCLEGNLDELPLYEEAEIASVSTVRYRYISDEKSPSSDEFLVKEVDLSYTSDIDSNAGIVNIYVTISEEFPTDQLNKLSKKELVIAVALSTAARMMPTNGSPKLGIRGDWSKANTYVVEAAGGKKKDWIIEVVSLEK